MNSAALQLINILGRGASHGYYWLKENDRPEQRGRKKTIWFETSTPSPVPSNKQGINIYFGVHPTNGIPQHNDGNGEARPTWAIRPYIEDIAAVNCLFGEFDFKSHPGGQPETLAKIETLEYAPSVLVHSGGGYHAYWLLEEPIILADAATRAAMAELQARWVPFVGSEKESKDLARVLRVPGTFNYKPEYGQPRAVTVMWADYNNLYKVPDFYRLLPQQEEQPQPAAVATGSRQPAQPGRAFTADDWINHFLSEARARIGAESRNDTGFWLSCQLRDAGISIDSARSAILQFQKSVENAFPHKEPYRENEALDSLNSAYHRPARAAARGNGGQHGAGQQPQPPNRNGHGHQPAQQAAQPAADRPAAPALPSGGALSEEQLLPTSFLPFSVLVDCFKDQETGDANLLAKLYANRIAFDHSEKQWYIWAGHYWQPDLTGLVCWLVARAVAPQYLYASSEALKAGKDELSEDLYKRARALQNRKRIDNVLYLAARHEDLRLSGLEWDKNPMLLGCENGVIDLATGDFRPGRAAEYIRAHTPVLWDSLQAQCRRFEKFILEIFDNDEEIAAFINRLLGYGITGLTTEHVLPILWGEGRNGKSTLLETLGDVLGAELATSSQADALMDTQKTGGGPQPFIFGLRGKRLVWASESNEGRRINAGLVKQLTGGDRLNVRTLHSKPVEFKPTHLLFLLTNHKPHISAEDSAIWERVLLVEFGLRFVDHPTGTKDRQKDAGLKNALAAELPGILAWLVRGCLAWQQQGLQPPAKVLAAVAEYRSEEDTTGQFFTDKCILRDGAEVRGGELYKAYVEWCKDGGITPMSQTALGKICKKRFGSRNSHGVIYTGIGLLAEI